MQKADKVDFFSLRHKPKQEAMPKGDCTSVHNVWHISAYFQSYNIKMLKNLQCKNSEHVNFIKTYIFIGQSEYTISIKI